MVPFPSIPMKTSLPRKKGKPQSKMLPCEGPPILLKTLFPVAVRLRKLPTRNGTSAVGTPAAAMTVAERGSSSGGQYQAAKGEGHGGSDGWAGWGKKRPLEPLSMKLPFETPLKTVVISPNWLTAKVLTAVGVLFG